MCPNLLRRAGVSVLITILVFPPSVLAADVTDSDAAGAVQAKRPVVDVSLS